MKSRAIMGGAAVVAIVLVLLYPMAGVSVGRESTEPPSATDTCGHIAIASPSNASDSSPLLTSPMSGEGAIVQERIDAGRSNQDLPESQLWLKGRIILPPGSPEDEVCLAVRSAADGSIDHILVKPDGTFNTPLHVASEAWEVDIDSQFLYLEAPRVITEADIEEDLLLRPRLGGLLEVALIPPLTSPQMAAELRSAEIVLMPLAMEARWESKAPTGDVDQDLVARFPALTPQRPYLLTVVPQATGERSARLAEARIGDLVVQPGRAKRIELPFVSSGSVRGRIVDNEGRGLDADVRHFHSFDGEGVRTQRNGGFELHNVVPGPLMLIVHHGGMERRYYDLGIVGPGQELEGVVIVFDQMGSIGGKVLWPDGSPAAGASLMLAPRRGEAVRGVPTVLEANEEGLFHLSGLEGDWFSLCASARLPDETKRDFIALVEGVAVGSMDLALVLEPSLAICGSVVDRLGRPVKEFDVVVSALDGPHGMRPRSRSFSDELGRFVFDGLCAGSWSISARRRGEGDAASELARIVLVSDDANVVLFAPLGSRVSGTVVDLEGRPVQRATVKVECGSGIFRGRGVTTNTAGAFSLEGLAAGRMSLFAYASGHSRSGRFALELGAGESRQGIVLALQRSGRLDVELDSTIVARADRKIGLISLNGVLDGPLVPSIAKYSRARTLQTDDKGHASVDVEPGRYGLILAHGDVPGSDRHIGEEVVVRAGETTRVCLGGSSSQVLVHGVVTCGRGPAVGQKIVFIRYGLPVARTETDEKGTYEVSLPQGEYDVGPYPHGWSVRVEVPDVERHSLDLVLPSASLTGIVRGPDREPAPFARVRLVRENSAAEHVRQMTVCSVEGAFVFSHVDAGTYCLVADNDHLPGTELIPRLGIAIIGDVFVDEGPVEGVEVMCTEPGVILAHVENGGGVPVDGAVVELLGPGPHHVPLRLDTLELCTNAAGEVRLPPFSSGLVHLQARIGERVGPIAEVNVPMGKDVRVRLLLE